MPWSAKIPATPPDAIMAANDAFRADPRPDKINVGIGMIMDHQTGMAWVPGVFKRIGKQTFGENEGYLPSIGHTGYLNAQAEVLIFGSGQWKQLKQQTACVQTIGGTKAVRLAIDLLNQGLPSDQKNILLDPGWPNHPKIIGDRFTIRTYEHETPGTRQYNNVAYLKALRGHPKNCPVLLQVCGYNADGSERSDEQWEEIIAIIKERRHQPILDFAYNGLVRGFGQDNKPVRRFAETGIQTLVCVSNSKNLGYALRLGALYVINLPQKTVQNVQNFLGNRLIRADYSNPPSHPARTFARILEDDALRKEYLEEIEAVRTGVLEHNRNALADALGQKYDWIRQKGGLFFYLKPDGLTDEQVEALKNEHALHIPKTSRINLGGIPPNRVKEVAEALKKIL